MNYRIIADSCCDKTQMLRNLENITFVPLTLEIGDYVIADDENFDQNDYVRRMKESGSVAKTACPSPDAWAKALECEEEEIFVITITDKLSGTYNSALQGVEIYSEEHPESTKKIHIFNSLATSGIESLTAEFIAAQKQSGKSFDEIVAATEDFILNHTELYFCLESLDVMKKNGRMFAVAASVLQKLRVKMIFRRTREGNISFAGQDIAMNRALVKLASIIADDVKSTDLSDKKLIISHVCCEERAQLLCEKTLSKVKFGSVEIVKCSGLNSTYASGGGIIVSYSK